MSTKNLIESAQAMDANTVKQGSARMKIIRADQRLAEARGVKALIVGPTGVGKTSLLRTLDPARVLFVDIEAGDLAVQDLALDTVRVDDWPTARDLACRIGGPNLSFPPTACYSQAHFSSVGGEFEHLDKYSIIFVDSITALSRLSFRHAEQQPEAFTPRGAKDTRGRVRTPRARNASVASSASTRTREDRRVRRYPRKGRR